MRCRKTYVERKEPCSTSRAVRPASDAPGVRLDGVSLSLVRPRRQTRRETRKSSRKPLRDSGDLGRLYLTGTPNHMGVDGLLRADSDRTSLRSVLVSAASDALNAEAPETDALADFRPGIRKFMLFPSKLNSS